jgi:hypothetical protein
MSAAPELPPVVFIPERARGHRPAVRRPNRFVVVAGQRDGIGDPVSLDGANDWGPVSWHRTAPADPAIAPVLRSTAAPVRLTRRGLVALGLLATVAASAVAFLAWLSAPTPVARPQVPAAITVQPGDTLWSLAETIAPNRDPRAEVDQLTRLNGLDSASLVPGQVIRTH